MSKIDCSKVLNYVSEKKRLCESNTEHCLSCVLSEIGCDIVDEITAEHIEILQKWSDEHPQQTMADKFFEIFPNAKKKENGLPLYCPHYLGWGEYEKCPKGQGVNISCADCWNRPYSEVTK